VHLQAGPRAQAHRAPGASVPRAPRAHDLPAGLGAVRALRAPGGGGRVSCSGVAAGWWALWEGQARAQLPPAALRPP
jgi:hypothetical protein